MSDQEIVCVSCGIVVSYELDDRRLCNDCEARLDYLYHHQK